MVYFWCHPKVRFWGLMMVALPEHYFVFDLAWIRVGSVATFDRLDADVVC